MTLRKNFLINKSVMEDIYTELTENNIDLDSDKYMENEAYKRLKEEIVFLWDNITVTKGAIIYKEFISDSIKERVNGIYSLGYSDRNHPEKYTIDELCDYIVANLLSEQDMDKDIKTYFERNKTGNNNDKKNGLIRRLFDWGIDLEKYNDIDKIKVLYYFFYLEKIAFVKENPIGPFLKTDRINIFQMLNNPTLENVYSSEYKTQNGDIIFKIKNDLFLEIPLYEMQYYNHCIMYAIRKIDDIINDSYKLLKSDSSTSLSRKMEFLPSLKDLEDITCTVSPSSSVFSDIYYKLLQHENLGRIQDILTLSLDDISERLPGNTRFKELKTNNMIPKENVKEYLQKNKESLVKIVFETDQVKNYDNDKYDRAVEIINGMISILSKNTRLYMEKSISEKVLITALQCFIFIDKTSFVENSFFHHNTSDKKRSLYKEMKSGTAAFEKNQLAIIMLIYDTYYMKCGFTNITDLHKFHNYADNVIRILMSSDNINQMLFTLAEVLPHLNGYLITDKAIINAFLKLNSKLADHYMLNIEKSIVKSFFALMDISTIFYQFIQGVNDAINSLKSSENFGFIILDEDLELEYHYNCEISINSYTKRVTVHSINVCGILLYE